MRSYNFGRFRIFGNKFIFLLFADNKSLVATRFYAVIYGHIQILYSNFWGIFYFARLQRAVNIAQKVAQEDQNIQIYPFILIGLETSMRRSEILSIRREHIDLQKRMIYIPNAKAGAREQPITSRLADFLAVHIKTLQPDIPWLFSSPTAKNGHTVTLDKPFRRCVTNAGLDPKQVVRHTLRHTAITHLVQAGVDLPTVKRISGHKTLSMVERYSHQSGANIESAMDKLEQRYRQFS